VRTRAGSEPGAAYAHPSTRHLRPFPQAARAKPPDPRNFESVLSGITGEMRGRGYAPSVVKRARLQLPRFFEHLRQNRIRDLRAVDDEHVFAYARRLAEQASPTTGKPHTVSTQTSYLIEIKRLFRYLLRLGVILRDPTLDLVLPTWSKLPRVVLTMDQARRLLSVTGPDTAGGKRDRAVLELLYGSGIRVRECERLDLHDLDLRHGTLFVRNGKGRKDRMVPIAGRAAVALENYLRQGRPQLAKDPAEHAVFLTAWGTRFKKEKIQDLMRRQVKAAGIEVHATPHTMRHSYATHLLQRGADIRHVQKLLGHSQIQTTALYARVAVEDLKKVVARAHPREKSGSKTRAAKRRG